MTREALGFCYGGRNLSALDYGGSSSSMALVALGIVAFDIVWWCHVKNMNIETLFIGIFVMNMLYEP